MTHTLWLLLPTRAEGAMRARREMSTVTPIGPRRGGVVRRLFGRYSWILMVAYVAILGLIVIKVSRLSFVPRGAPPRGVWIVLLLALAASYGLTLFPWSRKKEPMASPEGPGPPGSGLTWAQVYLPESGPRLGESWPSQSSFQQSPPHR